MTYLKGLGAFLLQFATIYYMYRRFNIPNPSGAITVGLMVTFILGIFAARARAYLLMEQETTGSLHALLQRGQLLEESHDSPRLFLRALFWLWSHCCCRSQMPKAL